MDVSVIIPAYNCEKTMALLLDALKCQDTNLLYEVIVVDNSSTDGTGKILATYENNYSVPLHITEQPRGVTIAAVRNHGARISQGHILAFIDSDCEPPSEWIQKGHDLLCKHGDGALLSGGCCPPMNGTWVETAWHSIRAGHKEGSVFVHGANFFISKILFDEVGGFREDIETSEDYDLGQRVAQNHAIIAVPEFMVVHYGEANTLYKKIIKERWYSRNVFVTLAANKFYKPFWIALSFLFFILLFCLSIVLTNFTIGGLSILGMLFLSAFLAGYFCKRAKNFKYVIPMIPICFAYLFGRSLGIIDSVKIRLFGVRKSC